MNRQKAVLACIVLLTLFLPACPVHAVDECTAKKFIHVKLNPYDLLKGGLVMDEFHLTDETNHDDGAFNLGQDYYDENHKCGIMVHTIGSFSVHGVDMVWAGKLGKLSKGSSGSIADDLGENYYACDPSECSTNPACKAGSGLLVLCNWETKFSSDGAAGPGGVVGADVTFGAKYGDARSSGSNIDLAVSAQKYGPKNDVLCGDDGKWHACDKSEGCKCIEVTQGASNGGAYSCVDGEWKWCEYGCGVDGKCKNPAPAQKSCQDVMLEGKGTDGTEDSTNTLGPLPDSCNIKVTVIEVSSGRQSASVTIKYSEGGEEKTRGSPPYGEVIECDGRDYDIANEGDMRCYVKCDAILNDNNKFKAAIHVCHESPPPKPKPEPDPGVIPKPKVKPVIERPTEEPKPNIPVPEYKEPEIKCSKYYGVLGIEDESGLHPVVKDPPECKFTQVVTVDNSPEGKCTMTEPGSFDSKDYQIIDIPPCPASAEQVYDIGQDVFGLIQTQPSKKAVETECPGEITAVDHHIPDNSNDIIFTIAFKNTGDKECGYQPCIYGLKDGTGDLSPPDAKKDAEWEEMRCHPDYVRLAPGEESSVEISSSGTNLWNLIKNLFGDKNLKDLTGWNIYDLNGKIDIKLFSQKDSEGKKEVDDKQNMVCKDNALELCRFTMYKMNEKLGREIPQEVYGVVDSTKYEVMAKDQKDDKENLKRFWLINNRQFHQMDVEECSRKVEGTQGDTVDVKFYTIVNDPEYRKYVKETFGDESFYKKFLDMGYDADYLYCFKTDLRNTSRCKEFNQLWYSLTLSGNNPRYIDRWYLDDIKDWNLYQAVDEITPLDKGFTRPAPDYDPTPCSIAMDRDYYLKGDNITLSYMNAPPKCYMRLYALSLDAATWNLKKEWVVSDSGNETYMPKEEDNEQRWEASLSMGSCMVKDDALVNITAAKNVMSKLFTITPFLEDTRNKVYWTRTGNATLYAGTGIDRYDKCELSCDSKKDCNTFEEDKCLPFAGTDECSKCSIENRNANDKDCTENSGGTCPDSNLHDCWEKVCKIDSNFSLQADVGKNTEGESFYGIPYDKTTGCPDGGFVKKDIAAYDHEWSSGDQPKVEQKCVIPDGVLAVTSMDFPVEIAKAGDSLKYVVASTVFIKNRSLTPDDNVWELYQEDTQDISVEELKEVKKNPENILIYVINDYGPSFHMENDLKQAGYQVDFKIRSGQGEVTEDFLKPYTQVWFINGGEDVEMINGKSVYLSDSEKQALYDYREAGGDLLMSVDNDDCGDPDKTYQRVLGEVAKNYGVQFSGCWRTTNGAGHCMKKDNTYSGGKFWMADHPFWTNVDVVSTTDTDAAMAIISGNPHSGNLKVLAKLGDQPYGIILLDEGKDKGRIVFDNSFARFYTGHSACKEANDAQYHKNIADWLSGVLEPYTTEEVKMTVYPSLHAIVRGNMPFNITYVNITNDSREYILKMIYVPKDASEAGRKLVVTSQIDFNYTLLEHSESFIADVNTTYVTQLTRNKYYTACNHQPCDCSCGGDQSAKNYGLSGGDVGSCGGLSSEQECVCDCSSGGSGCSIVTDKTRREIKTDIVDDTYSEADRLDVPGISHADVACNTLTQLKIEGTIDQLLDDKGNVVLASAVDKPMKITLTPDILGGFIMRVNTSFITYNALIYPVRHQLERKESSPIPDTQWNSLDDRYRAEDPRYGFPEQCGKTCPSMLCECSAGKPLEPECFVFGETSISRAPRDDCACVPEGCFANPCTSDRSFHEEEGSTIANGDFENDMTYWNKKSGDAEVVFHGISGKALKLKGVVEQEIPGLHTTPYNLLCLEYGINEYKENEGKLDLTISLDGVDKKFNVWTHSDQDCKGCLGWKKACFPVSGYLSKVRLESDVEVLVDNINLGKYYDYVGLYSYDVPRQEYMDLSTKGWDSFGLLRTDGIKHVDNTYTFNFRTMPRVNVETDKGLVTALFTPEDYKSGEILIQTHFDEIIVPLYPNTAGGKEVGKDATDAKQTDEKADEYPICYDLNLTIREPTFITLETSPTGFAVQKGTPVKVTAKLAYYRTKEPLANERVYFDLNGEDIWKCSPSEELKRDYIFNIKEIAQNKDQQKNLVEHFRSLGSKDFEAIALDLEGATYALNGEKVSITPKKGIAATLEIKDGAGLLTTADGKEIRIGVNGSADESDKNCVYASEYHKTLAYALTNDQGIASFTFKSKGTSITATNIGGMGSPSSATTGIHTVSIKSPLISGEFLFLVLVLVVGVFSYRFFRDRRLDLYSWWREFKGRK